MRFIESLRLEDGELCNLALHQRRLDLTLLAHFGSALHVDLARELAHRSLPASGLFKLRVTYSHRIETIDIDPYVRAPVRGIELVATEGIDYRFKYADRSLLDALRVGLPPGIQPLIVQQGLVTDAIYANVCFFDDLKWLTPIKPLLEGTARAAALKAGQIVPAMITSEQVRKGAYRSIKLINCMTSFEEADECPLNA